MSAQQNNSPPQKQVLGLQQDELKSKSILHVRDVYKSYNQKVILDNIDLSIAPGEFNCIVGPSGCGKSTLLRLILGQEFPDSGEISIDRELVGHANTERGIVYQKYSLFPHLTVLENTILGKQLQAGFFKAPFRRKAHIEEGMFYLDKMGLAQHYNKYPQELSGGMQQRAAIAQAIIMKPKILLMDEPFGALDPGTREFLQVFLMQIWEETKMTIFFVTHDLEEAVFIGTRLIALSQYYSDDRTQLLTKRGAKIVYDRKIGDREAATSSKCKSNPAFASIIQDIRQKAFDPEHLQHIKDFDLLHEDSFLTIMDDELHSK
jgi:NitT/TauT family transport system ATP-binding protein